MSNDDVAVIGIKAIEAVAHAKIDQRDAEIRRLRQTLSVISDLGLAMDGWWCAKQADLALKYSANTPRSGAERPAGADGSEVKA